MSLLLEVIVQSVADARAAALGGADRLEIVREIEREGLTPPSDLVRAIASETDLPLRVMVRESNGFSVAGRRELVMLQNAFAALAEIGVDGAVLGFATDRALDVETTKAIVAVSPSLRVTFHRAFDEAADPQAAISALRAVPQVDRILTTGGFGKWEERCLRLQAYARLAGSDLTVVAGGGIDVPEINSLVGCGFVGEVHAGRAAREPRLPSAPVSAGRVRQLKDAASAVR
jgi:copper homeostasis protein